MKLLRSIRKRYRSLFALYLACRGRYARPGTRAWLVERERRYGGFVDRLAQRRLSEFDTQSEQRYGTFSMTGGDRMNPRRHDYAPLYERWLAPLVQSGAPVTLVEIGILQGTGLAIWSDLFPDGRIIGLDIDLSHFEANRERLVRSGAFKSANCEVHPFDGFVDNRGLLKEILRGDPVRIAIDDASHIDESILATFESMQPFLAEDFRYIVEDNADIHRRLIENYPQYRIENAGELTLIANRQ